MLLNKRCQSLVDGLSYKNTQGTLKSTHKSWTFRLLCSLGIGHHWSIWRKLSNSLGLNFTFIFGRTLGILQIFRCLNHFILDCQLFSLYAWGVPQISPFRRNDSYVLFAKQEASFYNRMVGQPSVLKTSRSVMYQLHFLVRTA